MKQQIRQIDIFLFYFVNIYSHEAYVTLYTLITNKKIHTFALYFRLSLF